MPNVSKETTAKTADFGVAEDRSSELEGYTVNFVSIRETHDLGPMLKSLPGGNCSCPHWGYVFKGRMIVRYDDREEVFEAGDAFYTPPGHAPVKHEPGSEVVMFSPAAELKKTEAVMMKNMQAMQDGSTP